MTSPLKAKTDKHAAGVNATLFKALSHPLRFRILTVLGEREASPGELAEMLEEDLNRVCYHVKQLVESDPPLVELVDTDRSKGGEQHIYKSIARPILGMGDTDLMPRVLREVISVQILRPMLDDIRTSVEAGVFDSHHNRSAMRMPIVLDDEGVDETGEAVMDHIDRLQEITARAAGRLAEEGAEGKVFHTETLVFEAAPPSPR